MPDDHLKGLSICSPEEIARAVVESWPEARLDLGKKEHREALIYNITLHLNLLLKWDFEHKLSKACEKAIHHVFELMKDEQYQEKRKKRRRTRHNRRREAAEPKFSLEDFEGKPQ